MFCADSRTYTHPNGNELIPLKNDDYPFAEHIEDVLQRQSRRSGMILNSDELTGFVHLPSSAVRWPVFERQSIKSKAAPAIVRQHGLLLGNNDHAGQTVEVRLSPEQRTRHCHIIGASGTGKSTLLFNLIRQDIENGEGVAVLDPHGDLIDRILGIIPESRINDVVLVDPSDDQSSIGFNILSAHSELEKNLLASDLVAVFERLSTSWGDQMNSTTIDHEVGNVAKCLKAGVPKVMVICLDDERLRKIGNAVSGSLGAELASRVEYFQPDSFIAYLKTLKSPEPKASETEYGGYKIKRSIPKLSAQEQMQKEDIANRVMADTMRRK